MKRLVPLRPLLVAASASAAFALTACGNGPPGTSGSSSGSGTCSLGSDGSSLGTAQVKIAATDALAFSPSTQTVQAGQVVEWSTSGSVGHTLLFHGAAACLTPDNPEALNPGGGSGWEIKFTQAGTYTYECTIHAGMTGTITVTGSAPSGGSPGASSSPGTSPSASASASPS